MTHAAHGFSLPGLTGFTFQLALHGSRMQLEARQVADRLCRQPCCCLGCVA